MIFKILGAAGIVLISIGILLKNRKTKDILYIIGGFGLVSYSINVKDALFITVQTIFIIAAIADLIKMKYFEKSS